MNHRPSLCLLLSFSLLTCSSLAIDPLFKSCSSSENYGSQEAFGGNLNQLMLLLSSTTPSIGFGLGSVGKGVGRVNGLALCRGDVKRSVCARCIRKAGASIGQLCPSKKEAAVWFDECLVRYSGAEFFGEMDDKERFYLWNTESGSAEYNEKVMRLMNRLKTKAYLSPLLFAAGEVEVGGTGKLYGLAQCTRDLSGGDCKKCLENAIGELPSCCDGKQGGRVVGRSCNIRYELYPFFDS